MNPFTKLPVAALCACLLASSAAMAQPMPPPDRPEGGPPFLRGLDLSEEQHDRVFAILHAEVPKQRELDKAERKAGQALRDLSRASELDQARATASADALGRAVAAQKLLRLQTGAQLMAVLTPQQRAQLERERQEMDEPRKERSKDARRGRTSSPREAAK